VHLVKPLKAKIPALRFVAIDIENSPSTGRFLCAHLYSKELQVDIHFTQKQLLLDWLLSQHPIGSHKAPPFLLIGFNFGYDMPFLIEITQDKSTLWVNSRLITAKLINGIRLMDVSNHVESGQSLEDWIGFLDMGKHFGIKKLSLNQLAERNRFDAMATYEVGVFFRDFYHTELGIPMKLTVGSSAFTLFASRFLQETWYRSDEQQWINDYERMALRGGRSECLERGEIEHLSHDINSTYLAVMGQEFLPDPNTATFVKGSGQWEKHIREHLAIVRCHVRAPKSKIMVLPYVSDLGKLVFPCGEFDGIWTSIELLEAIKQGYKVLEVYDYIYYKRKYRYFEKFAQYVWSKRKKYQELNNTGMDKAIKKIGNTCYGKLGQSNIIGGYWGKVSDYDGVIPENARLSRVDGVDYITITSKEKQDALHAFPCIPVFVASYARLKLYRGMKANESDVIYCDTDSLKTHGQPVGIDIGKGLGQWGYEGKSIAIFHKPKWYGKKLKGVPKRAKELTMSEAIEYAVKIMKRHDLADRIQKSTEHCFFGFEKPTRFKEAIKSGKPINQWLPNLKIVCKADDKREWHGNLSDPLTIVYNRKYGKGKPNTPQKTQKLPM